MITSIGTFVGLRNGPAGEVFAVGGFIQPMEGGGTLSALGDRCPILEETDSYLSEEVLPNLRMNCASEQPEQLLRSFASWLRHVSQQPGTLVVVDDLDERYQVDPLEACRSAGMELPDFKSVKLSDLLLSIGVDCKERKSFEERVLSYNRSQRGDDNRYHPNNIGGDTVILALAAIRRGANVG